VVVGTPSDSGNITSLGAKTEEVACWLDDILLSGKLQHAHKWVLVVLPEGTKTFGPNLFLSTQKAMKLRLTLRLMTFN
jgi:hypothetical protein